MAYNFDRIADRYDATRSLPTRVTEQICAWVLARLPHDPAIAEIGIGTGRIALPFIKRGVKYTGFDISAEMMAKLREKLGEEPHRAQLFQADVTEPLPVAAASQDAVIAVHVLHLVDAVKALEQVRRMLKPHGALAWGYQQHDDLSPRWRIREYFSQVVTELGGPPPRELIPRSAQDRLAEWGAVGCRHVIATWSLEQTCRYVLDGLLERTMSSTWQIPEPTLVEAANRTEAWAKAEYGDLDQTRVMEERFVIDWYQF